MICEDCEETIPKGQRRTRCGYCGKLVCGWCMHHIHNVEITASAIAKARATAPADPAPSEEE